MSDFLNKNDNENPELQNAAAEAETVEAEIVEPSADTHHHNTTEVPHTHSQVPPTADAWQNPRPAPPPAPPQGNYGHHYNPNTGWNQGANFPPPYQPSRPSGYAPPPGQYTNSNNQKNNNSQYQWDFNQYDNAQGGAAPTPSGDAGAPKKKNRGLVVFCVVLGILLVSTLFTLIAIGTFQAIQDYDTPPHLSQSSQSGSSNLDPNAPGLDIQDKPSDGGSSSSTVDGRLSTSQVVKRVSPSVVGISQFGTINGQAVRGTGSGIVISADGYIVTNAHVIEGANSIEVILDNGDRYEAWVVGADKRTDLAVIKIDAQGLSFAAFGNSDQMEVGETVIAIGNPGGEELAGSVTQGIISALNRTIKTSADAYALTCLQTDAAINPGNSGGPLVNQFGQVIGINSAKLVEENYEGIGFAIPSNNAKPIIDQLIANGKITGRVRLGIQAFAIDESYALYYNLPAGIRILSTEQGSDISTKGLMVGEQTGDIITHIQGQAISNFDEVATILDDFKPGDSVELTIYRSAYNGKRAETFTISVILLEDNAN